MQPWQDKHSIYNEKVNFKNLDTAILGQLDIASKNCPVLLYQCHVMF